MHGMQIEMDRIILMVLKVQKNVYKQSIATPHTCGYLKEWTDGFQPVGQELCTAWEWQFMSRNIKEGVDINV